MTRPDDYTRLRHMLDAAEAAIKFTQGLTRERLDADLQKQMAVAHCLQVIGEASARLSHTTRAAIADLPWDDIRGMRNRIVHVYFDLDLDIVWRTVQDDLPPLIESLQRYFDGQSGPGR